MEKKEKEKLVGLVIMAGIMIICVRSCAKSSSPKKAASQVRINRDKRILGDNWYGCRNREYLNKLVEYCSNGDVQAFKTAINAGLLTGMCTYFQDGEVVYLTDASIWSGLVKIRRKGELKEYWTFTEAVSK